MSDRIKVAIKVRPLIKREDKNLPTQWMVQGNRIVTTDVELKKRGDGGFQFDHIFDTNARNNDVFNNIVKPIVDAAVNGFNGTVFAYGQTSSGKTFTMMGNPEEPGIIPLAVEYMFDAIANTSGREFLLRVSYLEIYNEKVNDLLTKNSMDLKIHEDINGQVFVHCKEEVTNCPENILSLMNKGNKHRRIGETNMNERSSRSHTIFRITIESREAGAGSDDAIQVSQLNMVDLAGSERARQTRATGKRFKEGCYINSSLSTLALVIKQLSELQDCSKKYINFRDSKLTRLLQASLGGNSMTAIICTVTPAILDETQCTLSFASRARNIRNKPELNKVMSDDVLLKRYAKQIDKLHSELERMKQFTQSTEIQEMESKMQEKDRINKNLEERIRLLQTRIVHSDIHNTDSFNQKKKRRHTWCGTAGYRLSAFQTCTKVSSPIKKISSNLHKNTNDIMDTTSQIALADFELELMNGEVDCEEEEEDIQKEKIKNIDLNNGLIKSFLIYNFNKELEERDLEIKKITELLKTKCDNLMEYKAQLEMIVSENTFLKQQSAERKASVEQYRMEMETLKMENAKEINAIKDKLNFEELTRVELNKQIAELNKKNAALTEEVNTLRDDHAMVQQKCLELKKRIRKSKILAKEQMEEHEELKDMNRSLQNNLKAATARIVKLYVSKAEMRKQLNTLHKKCI